MNYSELSSNSASQTINLEIANPEAPLDDFERMLNGLMNEMVPIAGHK